MTQGSPAAAAATSDREGTATGQTETSHRPPGCASGLFLQKPQNQAHEDSLRKPSLGTFPHNHCAAFTRAEVTCLARLLATLGAQGPDWRLRTAMNSVSAGRQEPTATPCPRGRPREALPEAGRVKGTGTTASPPLTPEESSTCNFLLSRSSLRAVVKQETTPAPPATSTPRPRNGNCVLPELPREGRGLHGEAQHESESVAALLVSAGPGSSSPSGARGS